MTRGTRDTVDGTGRGVQTAKGPEYGRKVRVAWVIPSTSASGQIRVLGVISLREMGLGAQEYNSGGSILIGSKGMKTNDSF